MWTEAEQKWKWLEGKYLYQWTDRHNNVSLCQDMHDNLYSSPRGQISPVPSPPRIQINERLPLMNSDPMFSPLPVLQTVAI